MKDNKNITEAKKEQNDKSLLKEYHSPEFKSLGTISDITKTVTYANNSRQSDGIADYS
ncbi:MAG: hypothetical protein ACNI25_03665 [Halarcobacter sp.]